MFFVPQPFLSTVRRQATHAQVVPFRDSSLRRLDRPLQGRMRRGKAGDGDPEW